MDSIEAEAAAARDIALAFGVPPLIFGVPPLILGLPGDNTHANYHEANRAFWRQTVIPLVARVQKSFSAWLAPAYGDFCFDYDLDRLDALAEERAKEWTRIGAASFLTDDEKREAVGYGPRAKGLEDAEISTGDSSADPAAPCGDGGDGANGGYWRQQPRDGAGRWACEGDGAATFVQPAASNEQAAIRSDGTSSEVCRLHAARCRIEASDATLPTSRGDGWAWQIYFNSCMEKVGCLGWV